MVKFLISVATAASALAIAAPASAQYYSPAYGYGYDNSSYTGYGYDNSSYAGYGYGYDNNRYGGYDRGYRYGGNNGSQRLFAINSQRIARIHGEIRELAMSGRVSPGEAASLDGTAAEFEQQLRWAARDGLSGREGATFDARLDRFERGIRLRLGTAEYGRYNRYDRRDRHDRHDD